MKNYRKKSLLNLFFVITFVLLFVFFYLLNTVKLWTFNSYNMAYVAMLLLNSDNVQQFLTNIAFLDAKRPYTKKVLERIDFLKIVNCLRYDDLISTEQSLYLPRYVTCSMYDTFKSVLKGERLIFA